MILAALVMIVAGSAIFMYIDGVVTAYWATNNPAAISFWWVELAILPAAIISIPVLLWCHSKWGSPRKAALRQSLMHFPPDNQFVDSRALLLFMLLR